MPPTIAVVGSIDPERSYDPPLRSADTAATAARQLGRRLADEGWRLVVYSSDGAYVEREVVAGYITSERAVANSVEVWGRSRQDLDFPGMATHTRCFRVLPEIGGEWEVGYYRSLLAVDAVLLIGGGRSTFVAGILALSRGVAVAPVAAFGGAARSVWERLAPDRDLADADEIAEFAAPWSDRAAEGIVASLTSQHRRATEAAARRRRSDRSAARRGTISLVIALVLLLVALATIPIIYLLPAGTWASLTFLVAAPFLASVSGAIIRNSLDGGRTWTRAAVLGAGSGTVAFLLFVAAQVAANPTMLTDDDGARRLITFLLPVGFVGGFTSETIYGKLREEDLAQTARLRPPTLDP